MSSQHPPSDVLPLKSHSSGSPLILAQFGTSTTEVTREPVTPCLRHSSLSDSDSRMSMSPDLSGKPSKVSNILGKVSEMINTLATSRHRNSVASTTTATDSDVNNMSSKSPSMNPRQSPGVTNISPTTTTNQIKHTPLSSRHSRSNSGCTSVKQLINAPCDELTNTHHTKNSGSGNSVARQNNLPAPKETNKIFLEYDPISRRKVLNAYEIIKEIGRGEHGKVKLAKDRSTDELVAIKIVDRKSKKDRPSLRKRSDATNFDDYDTKIKREIAIMKKCSHKHIVQLKEVLDDINSHKIYLVLEYLEKGEIKWKRKSHEKAANCNDNELPCFAKKSNRRHSSLNEQLDDNDLLSNDYMPNLTFKQARKVLRHVVLGLEYLHSQGIIHRDIKPANLLVSATNDVKISDFGVSYASTLNKNDDKSLMSEMELAKTAGTPAFFAPELCAFTPSSSYTSVDGLSMTKNDEEASSLPKVDHKIDIWALGVTLYCILFGKVPFNADSEFELFQVIVHKELEFPSDANSFGSPATVTTEEFELAKDLLKQMLNKNRRKRIDIPQIKSHPFVLMDLVDDIDQLNEFIYLNEGNQRFLENRILNTSTAGDSISQDDIQNAVIGVGNRIGKNLVNSIRRGGANVEARRKIMLDGAESNLSEGMSSSDDLSDGFMHTDMGKSISEACSVILSEAPQVSATPNHTFQITHDAHHPYVPSNLSSLSQQGGQSRSSSAGGSRDLRTPSIILQEMIESQSPSNLSRRGSGTGIPEAPMIETKRNVGGDLYMKTESALDIFKGIQKQDDKIRRSSVFTLPPQLPGTPKKISTTDTNDTTDTKSSSFNSYEFKNSSPINIEPRQSQQHNQLKQSPESTGIYLPLSGSLASLDSANDEYLAEKYLPNKMSYGRRRSSSTSEVDKYMELKPLTQISEQLKNFSMGTSMSNKKGIKFDLENDDDNRAPNENLRSGRNITRISSVSSSSTSESSEDEEEGNLTLAFSSKVAPNTRPHFLSMSNRAKSHDSNLPNLLRPTYELPIYMNENGSQSADVEDVPSGLIDMSRGSISIAPTITPTVSVLNSVTSSATIIPRQNNSPFQSESKVTFSNTAKSPVSPVTPTTKFDRFPIQKIDSPLRVEASANSNMDELEVGSEALNSNSMNSSQTFLNSQFNNHYKKSSLNFPFPNALHLDNDKESTSKNTFEARPANYRSNSVTVGLLQNNRETDE